MSNKPEPITQPSFKGLIGVARCDITPPVGIFNRNWGAAKKETANGIHRPLTATVLSFRASSQEAPMILAGMDLGFAPAKDLTERFQKVINTTIPDTAGIFINASHTHAGPRLANVSDQPGNEFVEPYVEKILDVIPNAVQSALQYEQDAELSWSYGTCDLAINRDLPDPDKDRIVCGFNPNQIADDTVLVGRVAGNDGKIIATILNYACHPTTLAWDNLKISPDYIGAAREVIENETKSLCLFLQGASGEMAPREQYVGDTSIADQNGRRLGFAALSALNGMLPPGTQLAFDGIVESGAPLATWKRTSYSPGSATGSIKIDLELDLKDLPTTAEIEKQMQETNDHVIKERLRRKRGVRQKVGDGQTTKMPLWIWKLGDSFLVGQPNEAYSKYQIDLRKHFPKTTIAVTNITGGGCGYLVPNELYKKDIYQEWQSPFAAGGLEKLTAESINGIERLLAE